MILDVYDPHECDRRGVPLDWARCRHCGGDGTAPPLMTTDPAEGRDACSRCGGHGSLRAAARHEKSLHRFPSGLVGHVLMPVAPLRCEDCGHPMSDGRWEDPTSYHAVALGYVETRARGERLILRGEEPRPVDVCACTASIHYSRCDMMCKHGGPGRVKQPTVLGDWGALHETWNAGEIARSAVVEASWRPVDVRTLGWPYDLRPEKIAILCLRCWADRRPVPVGAA